MARERRRRGESPVVRYDNDATVIMETPPVKEEKIVSAPIQRSRVMNSVSLSVLDVLDTLASFNTGWFEKEKAEKPGECYICHKQTPFRFRKVCADCMKKYSGEIYDLASEAVENGQTSITLNVVE